MAAGDPGKPARDFKELVVWQKAMDLAEMVKELSDGFPRDEIFGLTAQIRRAAVSVPCNIAEGQQRRGSREFLRFLSIASGSLGEVETQLILAIRFGYLTEARIQPAVALISECQRMIQAIRTRLDRRVE
jgi:four helix bundle protein